MVTARTFAIAAIAAAVIAEIAARQKVVPISVFVTRTDCVWQ